jgi:hypothetical protein
MNIHYSEIDDNTSETIGSTNYVNQKNGNQEKYWEKTQNQNKKPKKKVTFDDILTNMNLVVNKTGALEFMQPKNIDTEPNPQYTHQSHVKKSQEPIDPSVKHSYIYNKYFKDYRDANAPAPEVRVPKTIGEYRKMLWEDRIKKLQQQQRIAQIKSTKMMFTTHPDSNINIRNIKATSNNLRMMNFN